jgi:hypothetical protein
MSRWELWEGELFRPDWCMKSSTAWLADLYPNHAGGTGDFLSNWSIRPWTGGI